MLRLDNEAQSNKKCVPVMNSSVQSVIYRRLESMHIKIKCLEHVRAESRSLYGLQQLHRHNIARQASI